MNRGKLRPTRVREGLLLVALHVDVFICLVYLFGSDLVDICWAFSFGQVFNKDADQKVRFCPSPPCFWGALRRCVLQPPRNIASPILSCCSQCTVHVSIRACPGRWVLSVTCRSGLDISVSWANGPVVGG